MKVTTTLFFASCLFAVITGTGGAALGPPASLQYDEIVRVVVGQATPPPPGSFKADLAAINNPSSDQTAQAPPKKHGFGNILGAVLSGQNPVDAAAGNLADNAVAHAMGGMLGSLNAFTAFMRQGKVARYTFYNGWERVDDTAAQTATITKNDRHQVIVLDLQKKTYRTSDPTAQSSTAASTDAAPSKKSERSKETPEEPGTAVVDFSREGTLLGHEVLENVPTTGYRNKVTLAMTQATGSCRNGSFSVTSSQYLAKLQEPQVTSAGTVSRPAPRVPTDPQSAVTRGGCKPTFTAHNSGVNPPAGRFIMYSDVAMQPQDGNATPAPNAGTFSFVTERGNVIALPPSVAAPLFEIPPGFVPEK